MKQKLVCPQDLRTKVRNFSIRWDISFMCFQKLFVLTIVKIFNFLHKNNDSSLEEVLFKNISVGDAWYGINACNINKKWTLLDRI